MTGLKVTQVIKDNNLNCITNNKSSYVESPKVQY